MKKFGTLILFLVVATFFIFIYAHDKNTTDLDAPLKSSFEDYLESKNVVKGNPEDIETHYNQYIDERITEKMIQNFHASSENKIESRKAHVAHILIRTNKHMSVTEREAKYTRAYEAYSQLKSGANFAQIATEYSEDSLSSHKAGDLGWINKGTVSKQFSEFAFTKLKANGISKPFQSRFGFHIIKLIDGPKMLKTPLEKVKDEIRENLGQKLKKEMKHIMENAKTNRV